MLASLSIFLFRRVVTISMFISCSFQGRKFWTISVTSFENTLGRWIRKEKPACRQGIQVFWTAISQCCWLSQPAIVDLLRPMWCTRPYCFWQRNTIRRIVAGTCFHFIEHLVGCDPEILSLLIFLSKLRHYDRWKMGKLCNMEIDKFSCHLNNVVCMLQVTTFRVFFSSSLLGFMFSASCWLSKYSIFLADIINNKKVAVHRSLQNKPIMFSNTINCFQRWYRELETHVILIIYGNNRLLKNWDFFSGLCI